MKMFVTFKDPDTLIDTIAEAKWDLAKRLQVDLGLSEAGAEAEAEARFVKMEALAKRAFEYGEYVTIELDDETNKASVYVE